MTYSSAISIFLGAFLLFLVQPILGKMVLPWFGGSPAVWTTCMLFFQVLLLGGYAYAATLTRWLQPRHQAWLHTALLLLALCWLPIIPSVSWKPIDGELPVMRILLMLLACVGAPYFLLSATSPLVQTWFAHANPGQSPYRLYALSNMGSLGALLLYPLAIEPAIGTIQQGWLWSIGYALFVIVSATIAWQLRKTPTGANNKPTEQLFAAPSSVTTPVSWLDRASWLALPALASLMLLAITNHLCQDVAVVPFLWIAPLSLYLLSLIICFDRDQWYKSAWYAIAAIVVILIVSDMAFVAFVYQESETPPSWVTTMKFDLRWLLSVYLSLFFIACMLCHGEVVRRRPSPEQLTEFYLTISAGGALGGIIVAVLCPLIFTTFAELKIGISLTFLLAVGVLLRQLGLAQAFRDSAKSRTAKAGTPHKKARPIASEKVAQRTFQITPKLRYPVALVAVALIGVVFVAQSLVYEASNTAGPKIQVRNFYGSLTVRDWYPEDHPWVGRALYHGTILHGYQFLTPNKQLTPTTYYTESSGVGLTLRAIRGERPIKVGAVGLGIGTVAAYGEPGDIYRFYEINPLVIDLAKSGFYFLEKSRAETQVVAGDARLSLEREAAQNFDAMILDAFSGDSIPVHLLTREALNEYWRHLKPEGVLIVHISNRFVNLRPIVNRLALELDLGVIHVRSLEAVGLHISTSEWMALAKDPKVFDHPALVQHKVDLSSARDYTLWTDDYNNLIQVIRAP